MSQLQIDVETTLSKYDIFITGTTGFVGMAMLEKLIWLHNKINNDNLKNMKQRIYLLLRPSKKYSTIELRLNNEILLNNIFDEYNRDDLNYLIKTKRIIPINGDLTGMFDELF